MSDLAIRVIGLGKKYKIGAKEERYRTFRDTFTNAVATPLRRGKRLLSGEAYGGSGLNETIWALKDVSFEVKHGETIGIIGRNGAGKSSLLKVLSQITEPSTGTIDLYGRVGSMLEVGTGFHPELTGRENVYLNGAILGMRRVEINKKFDEIVDFSGVEKFIDTPVKHFSSGMQLRLGFAVAAHLEPEILVVDEVLAVGDAEFQKKCMGKMGDVANEGRTVLFVSHNMGAVSQLCQRGIFLESGEILQDDVVDKTIATYLGQQNNSSSDNSIAAYRRKDSKMNWYQGIFANEYKAPVHFSIYYGEPIIFKLIGDSANMHFQRFRVGVHFLTNNGQHILSFTTPSSSLGFISTDGKNTITCKIPALPLVPGQYWISVGAGNDGQLLDWLDNIFSLTILPPINTPETPLPKYRVDGYFYVRSDWEIT